MFRLLNSYFLRNISKYRLIQTSISKTGISIDFEMASQCRTQSSFRIKDIHEPKYLDYLEPQIPFYDLINIQVKGYDYAILENYIKHLHRLSNRLGLSVTKCWCQPYTSTKIETLQHESWVPEHIYDLNLYERNLQIEKISTSVMSMLLELVHRSLPAGVYLSIHEHQNEYEKSRYIVDHDLLQYKEDLKLLLSSKKDDEVVDSKKKK